MYAGMWCGTIWVATFHTHLAIWQTSTYCMQLLDFSWLLLYLGCVSSSSYGNNFFWCSIVLCWACRVVIYQLCFEYQLSCAYLPTDTLLLILFWGCYYCHGRLLNGNNFTGSLPSELGQLKNLNRLQIDQNNFSGSVPSSFGNLTSVQHL
jgi:hypothetical protein